MSTPSYQDPHDRSERVVRVFISSTFRDMHAERDHLVTAIFPQLRRLCESRGVTWGEVDLRWGVTDEAAAEGQVLPVCLEEIRRCRPYFIGLLGERYGWVPTCLPDALLEREAWLRELRHTGASVTELEILHGVLRNPAMAEHAFFYFRDPAWLDGLPPGARREDFFSEDTASAEKLRRLKHRIRASGLPVRENYPSPEALGSLVLADLTTVIDRLFPEGSDPDPLTREALDHAAYARSRRRVYVGRPASFARLDAHVDGSGDQPLVILGESGSGKSALLANWSARYRQAHPEVLVLEHYIGATPASADWAMMLRRILGGFKARLGLTPEIPDHPDALRSAFPNWLHMAAAKGRSVLVLDALNQLEDRDGAPDLVWLPPVLPEHVRLIVSTLPGRALDESTKRGWPRFIVEPLSVDERRELIRLFLHDYGRRLSPGRVDRLAAAPPSSNPLYLRVLLDELRLFGQHERLEERIAYYLQTASPDELYRRVIARWEDNFGRGTTLVGDTLSLLWAARRGLTESELLDALGRDDRPLPRATWSPLFLAMAGALVSRGGSLTFAHDFLRTAARDAYLPTESHQQQAHTRLADYFERQPASPRRTDELPWQLAQANSWQRLHALLGDLPFFAAAWDAAPFDVKASWAQVEAHSSLRMVDAYRPVLDAPEAHADAAWNLAILLHETGHHGEALRLRRFLVERYRQMGDSSRLAGAAGNLAALLHDLGELEQALSLLQEQERVCRSLGDWQGLATALGNRALIVQDSGDLDGALALHQQEEAICRESGDRNGLARSLGNQGTVLHTRGDLDRAMSLFQEQERICRELGNRDGLASVAGNEGTIYLSRGDLDRAMSLFQDQEGICRELGNRKGLARALGNQGTILKMQGNLDGAMVLHREVEQVFRDLGDCGGLAGALGNQALIHRARGERDAAMARLKEAERICRELGNVNELQLVLGNQALILADLGRLAEAMSLLKEQEQMCRELDSKEGLQRSLGNQAGILSATGDLVGALALHQEKERICRELGQPKGLAIALCNQAAILASLGRRREALERAGEANRLLTTFGLTDVARQARPILEDLGLRVG